MSMDTLFTLSQVLGGIGIFMVGMIVMTEGLRALAGSGNYCAGLAIDRVGTG